MRKLIFVFYAQWKFKHLERCLTQKAFKDLWHKSFSAILLTQEAFTFHWSQILSYTVSCTTVIIIFRCFPHSPVAMWSKKNRFHLYVLFNLLLFLFFSAGQLEGGFRSKIFYLQAWGIFSYYIYEYFLPFYIFLSSSLYIPFISIYLLSGRPYFAFCI